MRATRVHRRRASLEIFSTSVKGTKTPHLGEVASLVNRGGTRKLTSNKCATHILYAVSMNLLRTTCDAHSKSYRVCSRELRYITRTCARVRTILAFRVPRRTLVSATSERVSRGRKWAPCSNEKTGRSATMFQRGTICAACSSRTIAPKVRVSTRRRDMSRPTSRQ